MKKKELKDALSNEEYVFKIMRIASQRITDFGLNMSAARFKWYFLGESEYLPGQMVRAILTVLIQEETLAKYPSDWWQALKERWFKPWILRRWPVQYTEVLAVHKFPELSPPDEVLGREFVTLKLVDEDKLAKIGEEKVE